ncbi:MAG: diaminopimelate epimerase [Erysipelothrix sp.]|jgi:diaminopimelate epimerase|nr:diaminopimelate epimerase [Erysipelothrix sp.]
MSQSFVKYHATGNDFLIFSHALSNPSEVAIKHCHRRFGFGADGILFATPSEIADIKMHYYNADGSIASMCGNGYRAFVRYCLDKGLLEGTSFLVETAVGVIESSLYEDQDIELKFNTVIEELKPPHVLKPTKLKNPVHIENHLMHVLFVGTLHGVVFVDDPFKVSDELAHAMCTSSFFPHHINVNFVAVKSPTELSVRTYERGVGWTYSCGTGSVASGVVAHSVIGCESKLKVHVLGGDLSVRLHDSFWHLKGSATIVGKGEML